MQYVQSASICFKNIRCIHFPGAEVQHRFAMGWARQWGDRLSMTQLSPEALPWETSPTSLTEHDRAQQSSAEQLRQVRTTLDFGRLLNGVGSMTELSN